MMATFRMSQWCQDGVENWKCYKWRSKGGAFKDALENLNARKNIKNSSNRYFVKKLVNLSQILCSKPFSAWYLHENSPSKDKTFKVHIAPCNVIRIPESGKFCLWNPESSENLFLWNCKSWTWESGIQLKKSEIPLTIEIRNPSSTYKESEIYCLESGIHSVEFRIQDCLPFPYIMWHTNHDELYWQQPADKKIDHGKFTVPNTCTRILQVKTRHLWAALQTAAN